MPEPPRIDQPEVIDTEPARAEPTKGQWWMRGIRTAAQVGLVQILLQTYQAFATYPLTTEQYGILTTLGTTLLTIIQVVCEDAMGVALLRTPAGRARRRT